MAKVKNISGEPLFVPALGGRMVLAGQVVEVSEQAVYGFTQQTSTWAPADADAETAHDAADHEQRRLTEADYAYPATGTFDEPPAGNATREMWASWAVAVAGASPDDVADMRRDEIRTTYGPQEG